MKSKALRLMAAGGLMAAVLMPAAAANAVYGGGGTSGQGGSTDPGTTSTSSESTGTLPYTGGDVLELSVIGAGLAAGGFVLIRANRRRAAAV
jgi:LPXTG-motif cell wall-anchored protein